MASTDEEIVDNAIHAPLDDVGRRKSVGYLPQYTVRDFLGKSVEEVARSLAERGLSVMILSEDECPIGTGALFAFDRSMAEKIIERHADALRQKNWPPDVDHVMTQISTVWFEMDDPAMPLIRELYNDTLDC
jgi:hypothetical protein